MAMITIGVGMAVAQLCNPRTGMRRTPPVNQLLSVQHDAGNVLSSLPKKRTMSASGKFRPHDFCPPAAAENGTFEDQQTCQLSHRMLLMICIPPFYLTRAGESSK